MSMHKIGILLEFIGFFLEAILAGILLQSAIELGKERLISLSDELRKKRFIPDLPISFRIFAFTVIIIAIIDGVVVWGWLQNNLWFFCTGIAILCVFLLMALADKKTRDENIPPRTKPWLWPFSILTTFILVCIGIPLLFIVPVFLQIVVSIVYLIVQKLGRIKTIKSVLLILGALMILLGLALQYIAIT